MTKQTRLSSLWPGRRLLRQYILGGTIIQLHTNRLREDLILLLSTSYSSGSLRYHLIPKNHWVIWLPLIYSAATTHLTGHTSPSLPFAVASRDEPRTHTELRIQGPSRSRGIESLGMASTTGAVSPPSHPDPTNSSTLLAKRKRDDTTDLYHHLNGAHASKSAEPAMDSQSLIQDLVEVLKA